LTLLDNFKNKKEKTKKGLHMRKFHGEESVRTIEEDVALVEILSDLHSWEVTNLPILASISGRQLYFAVARQAIVMGRGPTVKEVVMAQHLTDRALRTKLAEMIESDYFELKASRSDGRAKSLHPKENYEKCLYSHIAEFKKIIDTHFYMIEREGVAISKLSERKRLAIRLPVVTN